MAPHQTSTKPFPEPMMTNNARIITDTADPHVSLDSGGYFKNAYELVNLGALKSSLLNKLHIFQYIGKVYFVLNFKGSVMLTGTSPVSFWVLGPITLNIFKHECTAGTHWNFIKTLKGPTVKNSSQQHWRVPLKFLTKYLTHTLKDTIFI